MGCMAKQLDHAQQIAALQERGIRLLAPETIFVGPEVDLHRLAPGVEIHPGCRLHGSELAIGPGCVLGEEGPATLRDCQLGARVRIRGGFFDRATLLDHVDAGSCAHVRPGTLLEEHASFGHGVGLKQTVLFPYVAMGSLINFCDCLMSGGTSEANHSEVGSSYVHFNYTPHQDKATPSLVGDVPYGVRLDQPPIFLGGQGGLVGPCRIAYGSVLAAGQICRHDILTPGHLVREATAVGEIDRPYDSRIMGGISRRVTSNLLYIGNLLALDAWWRVVRVRFAREPWQQHGHAGALLRLTEMLNERIKRLDQLSAKATLSLQLAPDSPGCRQQQAFVAGWPMMREALCAKTAARNTIQPSAPVAGILQAIAPDAAYLTWVQSLAPADKQHLTNWLQAMVDACGALCA